MSELELIKISLKDLFTKKMLKFSILPFVITLAITYLLFFGFIGNELDFSQLITVKIHDSQNMVGESFYLKWFDTFQYYVVTFLATFFIYTIGVIVMTVLSVFIALAIIGFFTPSILNILHKKYYNNLTIQGYGTPFTPLWVLIKNALIMILLLLLFIPLYFVPIINIIAFNLPFYYFFHKLLNYDVTSTILNKNDYEIIYKREKNLFRMRTFILYLLSLIPFIALFLAVFFVIYLGHGYFDALKRCKADVI